MKIVLFVIVICSCPVAVLGLECGSWNCRGQFGLEHWDAVGMEFRIVSADVDCWQCFGQSVGPVFLAVNFADVKVAAVDLFVKCSLGDPKMFGLL